MHKKYDHKQLRKDLTYLHKQLKFKKLLLKWSTDKLSDPPCPAVFIVLKRIRSRYNSLKTEFNLKRALLFQMKETYKLQENVSLIDGVYYTDRIDPILQVDTNKVAEAMCKKK